MSDSCATCNGNCCYNVVVRITGYDAFRIARAQALEFDQFVDVLADDPPQAGGFILGDKRFALFLGKNPAAPQACTFLMHLPEDVRRCGVYAERPRVCAVYPMTLRTGSVALRTDVSCSTSNWNMATITYPRWRESLLEHTFEVALYESVATVWNERVGPANAALARYFAFLKTAFASIDKARMAGGGELTQAILHWQDAAEEPPGAQRLREFVSSAERLAIEALD